MSTKVSAKWLNQVVQNADDDSPASKTELLIYFQLNDLLSVKPARKHFTEALKKCELARMALEAHGTLRHTGMGVNPWGAPTT